MRRRSNGDLHIRLPRTDLRLWHKMAKRDGADTLTDWIRGLASARIHEIVAAPPVVAPAVSGDQLSLPRVK